MEVWDAAKDASARAWGVTQEASVQGWNQAKSVARLVWDANHSVWTGVAGISGWLSGYNSRCLSGCLGLGTPVVFGMALGVRRFLAVTKVSRWLSLALSYFGPLAQLLRGPLCHSPAVMFVLCLSSMAIRRSSMTPSRWCIHNKLAITRAVARKAACQADLSPPIPGRHRRLGWLDDATRSCVFWIRVALLPNGTTL